MQRYLKSYYVLSFIILLISGCVVQPNKTNTYFDTNIPSTIPQLFAPGIISTIYHEHSSPNFSPDGKMFVYTLSCEHGHQLMLCSKKKDGIWTNPELLPFSGQYSDDSHVWSVDSSKLYFKSKRPILNEMTNNTFRDWFVTWNDKTGWGEPELNHFAPISFTSSEINYFHLENDSTSWDIYKSYPSTNYSESERISDDINTTKVEATPLIAPDESYLIFSSMGRHDAIGIMDLYISFKDHDGNWIQPVNMGEPINAPGQITRFPCLSHDGKFLFYWSNKDVKTASDSLSLMEQELTQYSPFVPKNGRDGNIYWVSTEIVEQFFETTKED